MRDNDLELEELLTVTLTRHEAEELLALAALWVEGVGEADGIGDGVPLDAFLCPGLTGAMVQLITALGGYGYDGPGSQFLA